MTALDFPDSPTNGQVFGQWTWNGTAWVLAPSSPGNGIVSLARVTATQAGITTIADITGLTATWVADPSRVYKLTAQTFPQLSVATDMGTTTIRTSAGVQVAQNDAGVQGGNYGKVCNTIAVLTGLSGSVSYKVSMSRTGTGTLSNLALSTYPALFLVEDITMSAGGSAAGVITPWTTATLTAPWTHNGGEPVQYRMRGDVVEWRGRANSASPTNTPFLTIPVGFRPPFDQPFVQAAVISAAWSQTIIWPRTDGTFGFLSGSVSAIALNGLTYSITI